MSGNTLAELIEDVSAISWDLCMRYEEQLRRLARDGAVWVDNDERWTENVAPYLRLVDNRLATGTKTHEGGLFEPSLLGKAAALLLGEATVLR